MKMEDVHIYAQLLQARKEIKTAYWDNYRNLREQNAPAIVFDRLYEETKYVLGELTRRIEAHPLHDPHN